jgi:hypothetical protein
MRIMTADRPVGRGNAERCALLVLLCGGCSTRSATAYNNTAFNNRRSTTLAARGNHALTSILGWSNVFVLKHELNSFV